MTPTELDAIFRAWRDAVFEGRPDLKVWTNHYSDLVNELFYQTDSTDVARHAIKHAVAEGLAYYDPPGSLRVVVIRGEPKPFSFPDPPPLPASAPIPFPAGKALLEEVERISYPYSDDSIVMRWVCVHHFPRWFETCPTCDILRTNENHEKTS